MKETERFYKVSWLYVSEIFQKEEWAESDVTFSEEEAKAYVWGLVRAGVTVKVREVGK